MRSNDSIFVSLFLDSTDPRLIIVKEKVVRGLWEKRDPSKKEKRSVNCRLKPRNQKVKIRRKKWFLGPQFTFSFLRSLFGWR